MPTKADDFTVTESPGTGTFVTETGEVTHPVIAERAELSAKITKLETFLGNLPAKVEHVIEAEVTAMKEQLVHMRAYLTALDQRIATWEKKL